MKDVDWGRMLVQIPQVYEDGTKSIFVRVPCFLYREDGPEGPDGPDMLTLRDKLTGKSVILSGGPIELMKYKMFMLQAMEVSETDDSLFASDGELYIVVNGWLTRMDGTGLTVHIGGRDCGMYFDGQRESK